MKTLTVVSRVKMSVSDYVALGLAIVTIVVVPAAGLWAKTIRGDIRTAKMELGGEMKILGVRLRSVAGRVKRLEHEKDKAYAALTASLSTLGSATQTQIAAANDRINEHAEVLAAHTSEIKNHSDEIGGIRKKNHDLSNFLMTMASAERARQAGATPPDLT